MNVGELIEILKTFDSRLEVLVAIDKQDFAGRPLVYGGDVCDVYRAKRIVAPGERPLGFKALDRIVRLGNPKLGTVNDPDALIIDARDARQDAPKGKP